MIRYLVITRRTPNFQESALSEHIAFLGDLKEKGEIVMSGAFTDHSGGIYLLKSESYAEAVTIAHRDPVYTTQSSEVIVCEVDITDNH